MTVFNKKVVDYTKEYMFFGEQLNVARYDKMKYKKFDDFTEQQLGFFWRPEKIPLSRDIHDFKYKLNDKERRIFIANLQYQILLDSVQGRSPIEILGPICSLPELENWLVTWTSSEVIHSKSYTYIVKNVFDNPSIVFDGIMENKNIIKRAEMVTKYYDQLEERILVGKFYNWTEECKLNAKVALFDCMVSIYSLEAVRFYVSFACAYSFVERALMEGNGKIVQEINRDEWGHTGAVHFILTRWLKGLDDPVMTEIANERLKSGKIVAIFKEVYDQEVEWIKYLMQDGEIPMVNTQTLTAYLGFICKRALDDINVKQSEFNISVNPIPWVDKYTNSSSVQVAPQETEISSYLTDATTTVSDLSHLNVDDL